MVFSSVTQSHVVRNHNGAHKQNSEKERHGGYEVVLELSEYSPLLYILRAVT